MTELNDKYLVTQLKSGSLEALGELYNRHRQMVYRTALAIVADQEAASDLLQDVFLRLYRFADHIDPERRLEPWLYRMTANLSYTWVKRNRRGMRLLEEMSEWFFSSSHKESPHELAEEKEEWEEVQRALFTLPVAQRVVVVMYYLNDLSVQEIAETLDIPVGTVKSRLHYGRRTLQNVLGLDYLTKKQSLSELKFEST